MTVLSLVQTVVAGHTPVRPYTVSGTALPDIPYVATAPKPMGGNTPGGLLLAGTAFILFFATPSITTRVLLADKSQVTMQFGLFDGSVITGLVSIASASVSSSSVFFPAYVCRPFMGPIPGGSRLGVVPPFLFQVTATLVNNVDLRLRIPAWQLM